MKSAVFETHRLVWMRGAAVAAMLIAAAPAVAQTGQSDGAASSVRARDVIVVTAQKRQQQAIDVPLSVTAFSESNLAMSGAVDLEDLQYSMPNVSVTNEFQTVTPKFSIRGISSNTRNIGFESGLSVYIDGVYTGRPASQSFDLTDVTQIEVLRGPQGTLYGKNNTAGAINIMTRRPSDTFEYNFLAEVGSFELARFAGGVSGPLNETISAKAALYSTQRGGTVLNVFDGTELNDIDSLGGRVGFYFTPSPTLDVSFTVDAFRDQRARSFPEPIAGQTAETPGFRTVNIDLNGREDRESGGLNLTLSKTFEGGLELTSITGRRMTRMDNQFIDNDDTPASVITVDGWVEDADQFSQEIRLTSPVGEVFDWIAGVYYFEQTASSARPVTVFGFGLNSTAEVESRSYAAFGQANWRPIENLTLTGGLRFTHEDKDLRNFVQTAPILFPTFGPLSASISDEDVSPMVSAVYAVSDNVNVYGTVSRGFKSGGFNADYIDDPALLSFDSESVTNYEMGVKGDLIDGRLRFAAAAFQMQYEDLQVLSLSQAFAGFFIQNAAEATINGFELELDAVVSDNLEVRGSLGLLDATYDSFANAQGGDFSGNNLPDAPSVTANISARYAHEFQGGGSLFAYGEWSFRDQRFAESSNIPLTTSVESSSLLNGRVGYASPDSRWELSLWGKNLADDDYEVFRFANPLSGQLSATYNDPLTYGVTLRVRG